jgi:hypothetical protein
MLHLHLLVGYVPISKTLTKRGAADASDKVLLIRAPHPTPLPLPACPSLHRLGSKPLPNLVLKSRLVIDAFHTPIHPAHISFDAWSIKGAGVFPLGWRTPFEPANYSGHDEKEGRHPGSVGLLQAASIACVVRGRVNSI